MSACVVCGGPMKVLFTGFYCPKDCDRKVGTSAKSYACVNTFECDGLRWLYTTLKPGNIYPSWVTRDRWCKPGEISLSYQIDRIKKAPFLRTHPLDRKSSVYVSVPKNSLLVPIVIGPL